MGDRKGITITLTILAVLLLAASVASIILSDNTAPKIYIEQSGLSYTEGDDVSGLLVGITAKDDRDGDVTDSIIVKDISVLGNGNTARVTYAARDKSNNISEKYRVVAYFPAEENYIEPEEEYVDIDSENSGNEEEYYNPESEESQETGDNPEEMIPEETEEEAVAEEAQEEAPKEETPKETAKKDENKQDDKAPAITLKQKSVTIGVGQTFSPADYIKTTKNASSTTIDGNINVMVPGTYPLTFKVTGPDGKTASETLTVVVK